MNVPAGSVQPFMRLVQALRRAIPRQVNVMWLTAQLEIASEKTAKNYLGEFRTLGVIDDNGAVTEIGHRLRLEESFGEACQMILQSKYPPSLLDAFEGTEPTEVAVTNILIKDGKAEATARRMAQFLVFLWKGKPAETSVKAPRRSQGANREVDVVQPTLMEEQTHATDEGPVGPKKDSAESGTLHRHRLVATPSTTLRYWLKNGRTAELVFPSDISDIERKRLFKHIEIDLNDHDAEDQD